MLNATMPHVICELLAMLQFCSLEKFFLLVLTLPGFRIFPTYWGSSQAGFFLSSELDILLYSYLNESFQQLCLSDVVFFFIFPCRVAEQWLG